MYGPVSRGLGDITAEQAAVVFREHRAACVRLRDMLAEECTWGRVRRERWANVPSPSLQDPAARFAEYERLRAEIGAYDIVRPFMGLCSCEIHLASYGPLFHAAYVAFVFAPDGAVPPDRPPVGDDPRWTRYTPLGDGWFLLHGQT